MDKIPSKKITLTFDLPDEILEGLADGRYRRVGSRIYNATGGIRAFLLETGVKDAGDIAQLVATRGFEALTIAGSAASIATGILSVVNLAVTVGGFKAVLNRLSGISHRLEDACSETQETRSFLQDSLLSELRSAVERIELARGRKDQSQAKTDLQHALQPLLDCRQKLYDQLLKTDLETWCIRRPRLLVDLIEALALANWGVCETILRQDELAQAREYATRYGRQYSELLTSLAEILRKENVIAGNEAGHFLLSRRLSGFREASDRLDGLGAEFEFLHESGFSAEEIDQLFNQAEQPGYAVIDVSD